MTSYQRALSISADRILQASEREEVEKMIPRCEESCLSDETSSALAASGVAANDLLHNCDVGVDGTKRLTAWKRYRHLVETMESRGQKFNQKLMLEAIFRGNNLVYSATANCNVS
jgi:hypothetical protein